MLVCPGFCHRPFTFNQRCTLSPPPFAVLFVSVDAKLWQPQWLVSSNGEGCHPVCIRVISLGPRSNVALKKKKRKTRHLSFCEVPEAQRVFQVCHSHICSFTCSSSILLFHSGIVQTRLGLTRLSEDPPIIFFFFLFARIPLPTGAGALSVQQSLRMVA